MRRSASGLACSHELMRSLLGSTAIMAWDLGANDWIDCSPETATAIGTRCSGRSQILAESTR